MFATTVWAAKAKTFASLEAARILSAFAGASTEGLAAAINADLFFLHERGWWMGVYVLFLNLGASLGSLIAGFAIQNLGWRWHFWVLDSFKLTNSDLRNFHRHQCCGHYLFPP